jgi:hypothetical protein
MLQLGSDPARVREDPPDAVVAEIRAFLDRV